MLRRCCLILPIAFALLLAAGDLYGQESSFVYDRGPGGYFSWVKLLLVAIVFVIWVRLADWLNRDAMKIGEQTGLSPEIWNPLSVGTFFLGFLIVISLPLFVAGYPIYLICALTPFLMYFFMRAGKIKAQPNLRDQLKTKPGEAPSAPPLPQDAGAQIDFTAAGTDSKVKQINLIRARQSIGYPALKDLIHDALFKRADVILLDFTREQVNCRLQVDGVWHPLPPMDRETGDAVLVSLKSLAGVNPAERRAKQAGEFDLKTEDEKASVELTTQGVPTGERAQVKFRRKVKGVLTLGQLGMFPEMTERLKGSLNHPGLAIISAPPGEGLTTSWRGALTTSDRLTRDCTAIVLEGESETTVENITIKTYDNTADKKQVDVLRGVVLTQPDFLATPQVDDKETMDILVIQATTQERSVLLRTPAKSAAEALLRLYAQSGDRNEFANAVKHVTGQRLVRRLCDTCKQEVRVPPKTIQQLGGDPKKQSTLFNQYRLPPPEQRVDEKGKPIEFPPCETCGGIGFIGRIAVFELIEVNDAVRTALKQTPKPDAIENAALKSGKKSLAQQAYQLVLLGVTSLAEVQRVLKS